MKKLILSASLLMAFQGTFAHVFSQNENIVNNTTLNSTLPTTIWSMSADTSWYSATATTFDLSTAEQLAGLAQLVQNGNSFSGKTINLTADIDLGVHLWISIGYDNDAPFSGTFNGNNHTIDNLKINRPNDEFLGVFGQVNGGTIINLKVSNAIIRGKGTAGAVAGNLYTNCTMTNCHAINVDIEVSSTGSMGSGYTAGSVVGGALTNTNISKCSGSGIVKGYAQIGGFIGSPWNNTTISECSFVGTVEGGQIVGGFVGFTTFGFGANTEVKFINCFSRGTVTGTNNVGGFQGLSQMGIAENCYAAATVTSQGARGGFFGSITPAAQTTNCYYDYTLANTVPVGDFTGTLPAIVEKTTAEMKTETFKNVLNNDTNVWQINASINEGYPAFENTLSVKSPKKVVTNLYPNPTSDFIQLETLEDIVSYQIYDMSGRLVEKAIQNNTQIDVSHLKSGNYIIRFETNQGFDTFKFTKK